MPKVKIEAKQVLDDIRAGLDDATIMEKYNLSIKGLHSVLEKLVALKALNESYIWTGRPPRDSGQPAGNRELSAKEVIRDIKSGMTDGQLMKKYKLSTKGLQHLLEQLMEAGVIKEDDLEIGKPMMESTVELTDELLSPAQESVPPTKEASDRVAPPPPVSPPPQVAPAPAKPTPAAKQAVPPRPPAAPTPAEDDTQPLESPPVPKKTQEVRVTDTAEPAFPSTVPITVVSDRAPEEVAPASSTANKKVVASPKQEPKEQAQQSPRDRTPQEEPTQDLWTATERLSGPVDEKPADRAASVQAPPPPPQQSAPREQTLSQQPAKPPEPVWKCPACGHAQPQAYEECPVCGIVVAKFLEHHKKSGEPEIKMRERSPEPKLRPVSVPQPEPPDVAASVREPEPPAAPAPIHEPEPPAAPSPIHESEPPWTPLPVRETEPASAPPPLHEPGAYAEPQLKAQQVPPPAKPEPAIKPRKKPVRQQVLEEQMPKPSPSETSGFLSPALTGLAVFQLMVVFVCVGVQFVLGPQQLASVGALAWSCGLPVLASVVVALLLHAAGVLVRLNKQILAETEKDRQTLRTILTKLDKHAD